MPHGSEIKMAGNHLGILDGPSLIAPWIQGLPPGGPEPRTMQGYSIGIASIYKKK